MAPTAAALPEPVWPVGFPAPRKEQWRKDYAAGLERAAADTEDEGAQRQAALKEANRALRVPKPTSYSAAKKLEDWQVLKSEVLLVEGVPTLKVVTIDGGKYFFEVPADELPVAGEEKPVVVTPVVATEGSKKAEGKK